MFAQRFSVSSSQPSLWTDLVNWWAVVVQLVKTAGQPCPGGAN